MRRRSSHLAFVFVLTAALVMAADVAHAAVVSKKVAVIMFKPQNYGTQWVTPDGARLVVWMGLKSVNAYYKEESFGKWEISSALRPDGDVFGWYTVPYDNTGTCPMSTWQSSARTMAARDGFVASNYQAVVYVTSATGCPGRAWASGNTVTVIGGFDTPTIAHELGHTFGLAHASAWACKDATNAVVTISSSCTVWEYGDFALMGATTTFHMNGYDKGVLGMLAASNTSTVTASGVYDLYPIEQPTPNVQVLRIPRTFDITGAPLDFYYLEYRRPFGFDTFAATDPRVNGVLVRVAGTYGTRGTRSFLLDATTPATTGFQDAAVAAGQTFYDEARHIAVKVLSVGPTAASVQIDYQAPPPPTTTTPPPTTTTPPSTDVVRGTTVTDSAGATWTLGSATTGGYQTLRGGTWMANGGAVEYALVSATLYVRNSSNFWYKWTGSSWAQQTTDPTASSLVRGTSITDSTGASWTLGAATTGGYKTLKNTAWMANGGAVEYVLKSAAVYVRNSASAWYKWTGSSWTGTTDPTK